MKARAANRLRRAHRTLARLGAVPVTWELPDGTVVRGDGLQAAGGDRFRSMFVAYGRHGERRSRTLRGVVRSSDGRTVGAKGAER